MSNRKLLGIALLAAALAALPALGATSDTGFSAQMNPILSRLQAMGHGYHTDAEWSSLFEDMEQLGIQLRDAGDLNALIELNVIKAMVASDMLGRNEQALSILEDAKKRYGQSGQPAMKRLYVQEAEVYSKMGDDAAINRLIEEFKRSPYYDPEDYPWTGGEGRNTPLTLVRPSAKGQDSISVTTMDVYRERSKLAPGNLFPEFKTTDVQGKALSLYDYRGKVVLLDFWLPGWTPWRNNLPYLVQTYQRYKPSGFEIVGVDLEPSPAGLDAFLKQNGMSWRQVANDPSLAKRLGVFGEATNFLIDQNGVIIGRDLRGAELVQAIRAALGME